MFLKALVVLSLAAVALAGVGKRIPIRERFPTGGKIVGGTEAAAGEIPFQVSLQTTGEFQSCGGSIISTEWILTAAHCSDITVSRYQVRAGTLTYASGGSVHSIEQIIIHEDYNAFTSENDIALWKVSPPFSFDANTGPVNLPAQGTASPAGTVVTVSGWGTTRSGGNVSPVLLKVDVPIVDYNDCNNSYNGDVPPNQICAGLDEGGKDSCQGDSGGPLYVDGSDTQHGVVSWGNGCALPGYPGIYTEVASYRDWIRTNSGV